MVKPVNVVQPEEVDEARADGLIVSPAEAPRLFVRGDGREMTVGSLPCILLTPEGEYALIYRLPFGEAAAKALLRVRARLLTELEEQARQCAVEVAALRQRAAAAEADLETAHRFSEKQVEEIHALRNRSFRGYLAAALEEAAKKLNQPQGR